MKQVLDLVLLSFDPILFLQVVQLLQFIINLGLTQWRNKSLITLIIIMYKIMFVNKMMRTVLMYRGVGPIPRAQINCQFFLWLEFILLIESDKVRINIFYVSFFPCIRTGRGVIALGTKLFTSNVFVYYLWVLKT